MSRPDFQYFSNFVSNADELYDTIYKQIFETNIPQITEFSPIYKADAFNKYFEPFVKST